MSSPAAIAQRQQRSRKNNNIIFDRSTEKVASNIIVPKKNTNVSIRNQTQGSLPTPVTISKSSVVDYEVPTKYTPEVAQQRYPPQQTAKSTTISTRDEFLEEYFNKLTEHVNTKLTQIVRNGQIDNVTIGGVPNVPEFIEEFVEDFKERGFTVTQEVEIITHEVKTDDGIEKRKTFTGKLKLNIMLFPIISADEDASQYNLSW